MSPLIVHCPKTAEAINTGIDTEYKSLTAAWNSSISVTCPQCNEQHEIQVRDGYVKGAISRFALERPSSPPQLAANSPRRLSASNFASSASIIAATSAIDISEGVRPAAIAGVTRNVL